MTTFQYDIPSVSAMIKSRRAHDRRHNLAARGGNRLHGSGYRRIIADLFHKGDGERACRHHIGYRAAAQHSHQAGGNHGRFRRAAAGSAKSSGGDLNKHIANAGKCQECAEQKVNGDKIRRSRGGSTENAVLRHKERGNQRVKAHAPVLQDSGHVLLRSNRTS